MADPFPDAMQEVLALHQRVRTLVEAQYPGYRIMRISGVTQERYATRNGIDGTLEAMLMHVEASYKVELEWAEYERLTEDPHPEKECEVTMLPSGDLKITGFAETRLWIYPRRRRSTKKTNE